MKVALLAGGLGGSRFARALTETIDPRDVTVVGNVGDDLEVSGLHVSPDLDTILYTLAGVLDEQKGWGRADETWNARDAAAEAGAETWFQLGDRDLGLHLARTEALRRGEPLSAVTARLAACLRRRGGARCPRPTTASAPGSRRLQASSRSRSGSSAARHEDEVDGVRFEGAEEARAAPGVLDALDAADLIAIAPSNPFVSIGPILAVEEIRARARGAPRPSGRRQPADRRPQPSAAPPTGCSPG